MTPQTNQEMSLIVRTASRWVKGFIILYGIQIILYGHLSPGGGFAGGVVAACAFVLIYLAEGKQIGLKTFSRGAAAILDSTGALIFLSMAFAGLFVSGAFFINVITTPESNYFQLFSGGLIPFSNLGIGLKVCCALYLVAVVLAETNETLMPNHNRHSSTNSTKIGRSEM